MARVNATIAAARAVQSIDHSGVKGQLREIVVRNLLRPLLPQGIGIGSGMVISADGETSAQHDLVLYDAAVVPPASFEGELGLFPVESVVFVIEVKSRVTATEVKAAHDSAVRLGALKHALPFGQPAWGEGDRVESCIPILFGFDSDLTLEGKSEVQRYDQYRDPTAEAPIRGICVAGRGCWIRERSDWRPWPLGESGSEVLGLLIAVTNAFGRVLQTRRRPDLAAYIGHRAPEQPR